MPWKSQQSLNTINKSSIQDLSDEQASTVKGGTFVEYLLIIYSNRTASTSKGAGGFGFGGGNGVYSHGIVSRSASTSDSTRNGFVTGGWGG